jgi:hypothetical protein
MPMMRSNRPAVVDVAGIPKLPAIPKSIADDQLMSRGRVHESDGLSPSALIKVTSGPCIMPRIVDMAAPGKAADMPRPIAGGDKFSHEAPKPAGKARCDLNRDACRSLDHNDPASGHSRAYISRC